MHHRPSIGHHKIPSTQYFADRPTVWPTGKMFLYRGSSVIKPYFLHFLLLEISPPLSLDHFPPLISSFSCVLASISSSDSRIPSRFEHFEPNETSFRCLVFYFRHSGLVSLEFFSISVPLPHFGFSGPLGVDFLLTLHILVRFFVFRPFSHSLRDGGRSSTGRNPSRA